MPESPLPPLTPAPGPIAEGERISAIDATRGLALLGIFMVNIQLMAHPLGVALKGGLGDESTWSRLAWHVQHVLAESRSFPLFSMLFGMGIAMQWSRAQAAGRAFTPTYVRRLLVLGVLGLAHALLLWFGDILFYYACVGFVLLAFVRRQPRTQAMWGLGFYGLSIAMMAAMLALSLLAAELSSSAGESPPLQGTTEVATADPSVSNLPSVHDLLSGFTEGKGQSPDDPLWIGAETRSLRDGPYADATFMRLILWASGLFFYFLLTGHVVMILGLFLLGSAMLRSGVLFDPASPWPRRLAILGLGVALPVTIAASILTRHAGSEVGREIAAAIHLLIGPIQSMGYLGAIALVYRRARRPGAWAWLEAAGRMPLSNYLSQSVVGSIVFQHWGFARFAAWPYWQCLLLVLGVFVVQVLISRAWMARFRFGPLEWLWRTLSYGRPPAMRRSNPVGVATGE